MWKLIVLLNIFGLVISENVSFQSCPGYTQNCVIHAVRIDPCPEAANDQACKIKRGGSAIIEFDYTPDFDAETVLGKVYWSREIDLPLIGMDSDGCKYTQCPVVKNKQTTYKITLPIERKFPPNHYNIKWRLTGAADQECCFITRIQLPR